MARWRGGGVTAAAGATSAIRRRMARGVQAHPFFSYAALFLAVRFSLQLAVSRVFHHGYLSSSASVIEHDHLLERMLISQAKVVDCPFGLTYSGHAYPALHCCASRLLRPPV